MSVIPQFKKGLGPVPERSKGHSFLQEDAYSRLHALVSKVWASCQPHKPSGWAPLWSTQTAQLYMSTLAGSYVIGLVQSCLLMQARPIRALLWILFQLDPRKSYTLLVKVKRLIAWVISDRFLLFGKKKNAFGSDKKWCQHHKEVRTRNGKHSIKHWSSWFRKCLWSAASLPSHGCVVWLFSPPLDLMSQ